MPDDVNTGPGTSRASAGMPCPACRVSLVMSERQGVEIDYCPQCRGVWLDRGELDKILERSAAELSPRPPAPPPSGYGGDPREYRDRDHDRHDYKHHKRRKSFLEELFD
jgi:Zn-finger nucleic acid-binding protein